MKIFWQKKYNILLLLDMDVIIDLFYHHGDNLNKNITVTTMFAAWQAAVNRLQSNFQITAAGVLSAQHCSRLINEMPVVHLYKMIEQQMGATSSEENCIYTNSVVHMQLK